MTISILCLILAAAIIFVTKLPVAIAMKQLDGRYDNHQPRAQQARLTGFGARALAAHQNSIEAFPLFAAGVLAALWAGANEQTINTLAIVFVLARMGYVILYWIDQDKLRSLIWMVGTVASFWLMFLAL